MNTEIKPEIQSHTIALVGSFNPTIFQPAWFFSQDLIKKIESDDAKITVIHPEIVLFNTAWFKLQVTSDRFLITTLQENSYELIRDLVLGTFTILSHTPIKMLGINMNIHYQAKSEKEWHEIGDALTPKDIWKKFLPKPGMRQIAIESPREEDAYKGYTRISVSPSKQVANGISFDINDHYEANNNDIDLDCLKIIKNEWKSSYEKSIGLTKNIMKELRDNASA